MLEPDKAKVGLEVVVREHPLQVGDQVFKVPHPVKGRIYSLDVPEKNRGQGCWVMNLKNHRTMFCRWDELSIRRPKEGERKKTS